MDHFGSIATILWNKAVPSSPPPGRLPLALRFVDGYPSIRDLGSGIMVR